MNQLTTTNQLTQEGKDTLESMLDSTSLSYMLEVLAEICFEKSEHIQANWQDGPLAHAWQRASNKLWSVTDAEVFKVVS